MVDDLLWHELEVIKSFFTRSMSWVDKESATESARIARIDNPDNDTIEDIFTHPRGANCLEQIAIRAVVNELNALCEFALQNIWLSLSGHELPKGEFFLTVTRAEIEKALLSHGVNVALWPQWSEVSKIKELSEGFKHRQRMQPFPIELQKKPTLVGRSKRIVDPNNTEMFAGYDLMPSHADQFLSAVEELLLWLRSEYAI